jgi:ribosomal protein L37AE/L43A
MSVTSGTKMADGTVVIQGDAQNMDKLRCMRCHGLATKQTRPNGTRVFKCSGCGAEWVATRF